MKIWHISDTHGYHGLVNIPTDIDIVIHSGDCSNWKDPYKNEQEVRNFITWYNSLPIKHKVYVAGNHDTSIERGLITRDNFEQSRIHYLENESILIEGVNIWGSPHTPTFGDWAFMKARHKLDRVWQSIPENMDIIISHGPPKGILDLAYSFKNELERCGCNALRKRLLHLQPQLFLFGHIHNNEDLTNSGTMKLANCKTLFSNGTAVTDGKFGYISSHGNILNIEVNG